MCDISTCGEAKIIDIIFVADVCNECPRHPFHSLCEYQQLEALF